MKLAKGKMLRWFPTNYIYKTIPLFIEVDFLDGKEESCSALGLIIITLIAYLAFSSDILINLCLATNPKAKEKPIGETIIKILW